MYSDWDDAPDRIRQRRGEKPPRIVLWLMVLAVLAVGIAYAAFRPASLQPNLQNATAPSAASSETPQNQLVNPSPLTTQQTEAPRASIE